MPAVLVTGPTSSQNSLFLSPQWPWLSPCSTHSAYSRRDGQAELPWVVD